MSLFAALQEISQRPEPHAYYTTPELWNDPYISQQMLALHLDPDQGLASRTGAAIAASVAWIFGRFQLGPRTRVCDFGCGPGLYTRGFAETGASVTGIDFSERSIAYAGKVNQEKGLGIRYVLQNYLDADVEGPFDLITLIFCDFCVLSPKQRGQLLGRMHSLLAPGGHLLLDVVSKFFFAATPEQQSWEYAARDGFWAPGPHHVFKKTFRYEERSLLLDKYVILEPNCRRESYNWLQCYDLQSLQEEFAAAGLRIIEQYADVAGAAFAADSKEFAVVAVK